MDCPQTPSFTKTEKCLMLVIMIIVLVTVGYSMCSCQQLGIDPNTDIDDELTIGIQKHHKDPEPKPANDAKAAKKK